MLGKLKKMPRKKILIGVVLLAIYLNIGCLVGYYFNQLQVTPREKFTTFDRIATGGWDWWYGYEKELSNSEQIKGLIICSVGWPALVFLVVISWVLYGAYFLVWIISLGGLAQISGLEALIFH